MKINFTTSFFYRTAQKTYQLPVSYLVVVMVITSLLALPLNNFGQILIPNTTAVTENFDGMNFSGAGTNGASTTSLPANWKMCPAGGGATATWANVSNVTTVTQQYNSGTPATGGRYVWGNSVTASDKALGVMTSAGYTSSNSIMAHYRNTNTSNLTSLTIAYDLERYRINTNTASLAFFYSTDGNTWTAVAAGDIAIASLPTGTSVYDFNPSGTPATNVAGKISKSGISITGLNIATNGNIYLRWNITNTSNTNAQGLGIDNVSVVAGFATPSIVLSDNSLSGFTYMVGMGPSGTQTFTISASNLVPAAGNITVTAPVNYEISLNNFGSTAPSYNLAYAGGALSSTTIYVRLKAGLGIANYNGEIITCSGGGASSETVTCNGTVTNFFNSLSDVVAVASSEAATISSTVNTNPPLTSATGVQVWQFIIRDGGGSPDADNLPTIVNAITLAQAAGNAVSNWSQAIKTISIFDGGTLMGTGTVTATQIQFTGLTLVAPDNTNKTITIRLSLNCGIGGANSDGDDFGFSLSNANFTTASSSTSSQKSSFSAITSNNGSNVIDVTATRLIFSQQPQSNVSVNNNFSPAVTVTATDNCGNVDKGFTGTINITSSGTLLSSPQTAAAVAGIASFSGISHTAAGGPFNLTATSTGLTSAVSNPFNVTLSTTLGSGDLMIVGFDTYVTGGSDLVSIANFVPLLPTTTFTIANAVYDWIAPAGVRQDRWYNGNDNDGVPFVNGVPFAKFTYNGASNIAAGSVICISITGSGIIAGITVNGVDRYADFNITNATGADGKTTSTNIAISSSVPDAWFLMQGDFNPLFTDNTDGTNLYRTFTGIVFGGLQTNGTFQSFSVAGNAGGNRVSRVHPNMECVAISTGGGSTAAFYGYYKASSLHVSSHRNLIKAIAAYSGTNWTKATTGNVDGNDLSGDATCTNSFTVTSNVSPGLWSGDVSTDWFDCNNWDDFNVPTSTTDVLITNSAVNNAQISSLSSKAAQFLYTGNAKSLNIIGKQLIIQNTGATINTLDVAGDLTINTINGLDMNDGVGGTTDGTVNIQGNWTNNFTTGFDAGESLINFNGTTAQTITAPDGEMFYNFTNSNTSTGVSLANNNANVTVNNIFSLSNGLLTINLNTLTLNGTVAGSGTITGSNNSNLIIGGTAGGALGTLNFTAGSRLLNNITMNRTGASASATLGTDLAINTLATITAGTLIAGTNSFSGTGGLTMTGGELQVGRAGVTSPELTGAYSLTAGVVNFIGSGSQTVRAVNYYDLTSTSTGARIMASSGTIGIANAFTKGTNAYTFTGSTVDYNGTIANQNITPFTAASAPGSTYDNLTLSNSLNTGTSKTITAATDVEGDLTLNNSISLKLGANYLNLKSTATKTARVAPVSNAATIDYASGGRFVVERYYPGRRKWRLITAPVTVDATKTIFNSWQVGGASPVGSGTYVTGPSPTGAGGNGLDASPQNNYSLKIYNTNTNVWDGISNTKSNLISGTAGGAGLPDNIGYFMFVRGDRTAANVNAFNPSGAVLETTLRDTGKIQVQSYDFSGNPTIGQYAVVGNPYASPVDFGSASITKTSIANKFYAWDPGINGYNGVGGYVIVDLALGTTTTVPASQSGVSQTQIIQSKQAIVIETTGGSPKITFNEAAKSNVNNLALFRPSPNNIASIAVNLHAVAADETTVLSDGVLVQFRNDLSNDIDHLDGLKFGNVNETFSIMNGNTALMLERRKPVRNGDTILLSLKKTKLQPYRFNIVLNNMTGRGLLAYVADRYLNTFTPVNMNGSTWLDFTISSDAGSSAANRFFIVFKKVARFNTIKADNVGADVMVNWNVDNAAVVDRYEVERSVNGVDFEKVGDKETIKNGEVATVYTFADLDPEPGVYYYRVKAISSVFNVYEYTDAVKVKVTRHKGELYVYPNPVTNNVIGLRMNMAKPEGIYGIRLINSNGQIVMTTQLQHNKNTTTEAVPYPSDITDGTYQLEVTGPDKKKSVITIIIVKQ